MGHVIRSERSIPTDGDEVSRSKRVVAKHGRPVIGVQQNRWLRPQLNFPRKWVEPNILLRIGVMSWLSRSKAYFERRHFKKNFSGVMARILQSDDVTQTEIGRSINFANGFLVATFVSLDAFRKAPRSAQMECMKSIYALADDCGTDNTVPTLGFTLFGMYLATLIEKDEELEKKFGSELEYLSRKVDVYHPESEKTAHTKPTTTSNHHLPSPPVNARNESPSDQLTLGPDEKSFSFPPGTKFFNFCKGLPVAVQPDMSMFLCNRSPTSRFEFGHLLNDTYAKKITLEEFDKLVDSFKTDVPFSCSWDASDLKQELVGGESKRYIDPANDSADLGLWAALNMHAKIRPPLSARPCGVPLDTLQVNLEAAGREVRRISNALTIQHPSGLETRLEIDTPAHSDTGIGRIRAVVRVGTAVLAPAAELISRQGFAATFNRMATLGAITNEDGILYVGSRVTIYENDDAWSLLGPLLLCAAVDGGTPMLAAANGAHLDRAIYATKSAWTGTDMQGAKQLLEQICLCTAADGGLTAEFGVSVKDVSTAVGDNTVLWEMHTDVPHPALGFGLLCVLKLPQLIVNEGQLDTIVQELNCREMLEEDLPPHFGAWCSEDRKRVAYVSFLPNELYSVVGIATNVSFWAKERAKWASAILHGEFNYGVHQG
jgi:hypothetical protein